MAKKTSGTKTTAKGPTKAPRAVGKHSGRKAAVSVDLVQARADFVRFLIEQDFQNATGAYSRAYPRASEATAATESSRLLKDPKIQEAISTELKAVLAEKRVPLEKRILDYWITRAFYDPTEIIDLRGNLRMTETQLRKRGLFVVIDSTNKKLNAKGDEYMEYKFADRDKAVDMLQKYIAMIREPDKNLNVNVGGGVLKVPAAMSAEEWAATAAVQQDALISTAVKS